MLNGKVEELSIEDVVPDPNQPRKHFDETKLQELAQSIQQHDLLQPILVRPLQNGKFQIVHGERRWRACNLVGLKIIKAEVRQLDDKRVLEIRLAENLQRQDLNPIEQAEIFRRMIDELDYTHEELGKRIGKSREYVTNKLRLLDLSEDIKKALQNGKIKESHARALLPLEGSKQKEVLNKILVNDLKVRQIKEILELIGSKRKSTKGLQSVLKPKVAHCDVDSDDLSTNPIYPMCKEWNQLSADVRHKITLTLHNLRKEINELMGLPPTSSNILFKLIEAQTAIHNISDFFQTVDAIVSIWVKKVEEQQIKTIRKLSKKAEADRLFKTQKPEPGQTTLPEVTPIVQK